MTLPQESGNPAPAGQSEPGAPPEQAPAQQVAPAPQAPAPQAPAQPEAAAPPEAPAQPEAAAPPEMPAPPRARAPAQHVLRRTRVGGVWVASALFALVLLLLLIFILENGSKVKISFFGASGHLPLGVALLLAAVLGVLLVVLPGSARIIQLRRTARRHRKLDAKAAKADVAPPSQQSPASGGVGRP
jgi:lipopolysaccharide assembly protein A